MNLLLSLMTLHLNGQADGRVWADRLRARASMPAAASLQSNGHTTTRRATARWWPDRLPASRSPPRLLALHIVEGRGRAELVEQLRKEHQLVVINGRKLCQHLVPQTLIG